LSAKDTRDLRDPQELGKQLMEQRKLARNTLLSRVYDEYVKFMVVPDYDPLPVKHGKEYREELAERALNGDKYAASLLAGESMAEDPVD
jgi:RecB family exonuclease